MELRDLGQTDIRVSPLGLGTVKLGRNEQVKYPQSFSIPDDTSVRELLALAQELGINLIDTAPAYGNSEERLGRLLPNPDDWVIVTKVGEQFRKGQSSFDFSAKATRDSVEQSLRYLMRDYLDVVLVHSDGDDMRIIEHEAVLPVLDEMKQAGLIQAYGISTKTVEGGLWAAKNTDVVMATCNRSDMHDLPVIEEAHQQHTGVLIKKGLDSGHVSEAKGGGGVEDGLRFISEHAGVSSIIIGTINPVHLRENVTLLENILKQAP